MANSPAGKILLFSDLVDKVRSLQSQGKKIVQSHGVYDLIHPGIVKHLNAANRDGGDLQHPPAHVNFI